MKGIFERRLGGEGGEMDSVHAKLKNKKLDL